MITLQFTTEQARILSAMVRSTREQAEQWLAAHKSGAGTPNLDNILDVIDEGLDQDAMLAVERGD